MICVFVEVELRKESTESQTNVAQRESLLMQRPAHPALNVLNVYQNSYKIRIEDRQLNETKIIK